MNAVPDFITRAEDSWAARHERETAAYERAQEQLEAEFMAAACVPLIATVSVPLAGQPGRRSPFVDQFYDQLTEPKNHDLAARLVSIAMRTVEGLEIVKTMAKQHAEFWADGVEGSDE